jgi:HEAT repeat protein
MTNHSIPGRFQLEARYRALLVGQFRALRLEGLTADARPVVLSLEEVYVQLRAVAAVPEAADAFTPEERRLLKLLEERHLPDAELREAQLHLDAIRHHRWTHERPERFPIAQALSDRDKRGLVILGDPGSGKSTLLHLLALLFAQGPQAVAKHTPARGADADRLPIVAPLAAYDAALDEQPDLDLPDFLVYFYARFHDLPGLAPVFEAAIAQGRALLLLDGLDEVRSEARRRTVAERVTRFVQAALGRGNRAIVTSRISGYRVAPLGGDLPHVTVLDFGQEEIATFTRQWYRAVRRAQAGGDLSVAAERQAAEEERRLLDEIARAPGVERLAVNPLLLTLLVLLREQLGSLPQHRIRLYDTFVATLLQRWEQLRRRSAHQHDTLHPADLRATEDALAALAFWLQFHRPSGTATASDLLTVLRDFYLRTDHGLWIGHDLLTPEAFQAAVLRAAMVFQEMRAQGGLLTERGQNAFGFRHLTFQEYFAGRALTHLPAEERWALLQLTLHSGRWREPLRLCAARLGVSEGRTAEAQALVAHILEAGSEYEAQLHRDLLLAADCAADDIGVDQLLLQQIADALWPLLKARVPALVQAALQRLFHLWRLREEGQIRLPELEQRLLVWLLPVMLCRYGRFDTPACDMLRQMVRDNAAHARTFLLDRLDDPGSGIRSVAVAFLAQRVPRDAEVCQRLAACLTDPEPNVQAAAVQALAGVAASDDTIRRAIADFLTHECSELREEAVCALAPLASTHTDIRQALVARFADEAWEVRAAAVDALARLDPSRFGLREELLGYLANPCEPVQEAAVQALGVLTATDPEVRQELRERLTHEAIDVRKAAVNALAQLAPSDAPLRQALLARVSDEWYSVREAAVKALGRLARSDTTICQALVERLGDDACEVREAAAAALGPLAPTHPAVRQALTVCLLDDDQDVRKLALGFLSPLMETDPQLQRQIDQMRTHRDWQTRCDLVPYLPDLDALFACCQQTACNESSVAQAAIVTTLGMVCRTHPPALAAVRGRLTDDQEDVRVAAVRTLAELADTDRNIRADLLERLADLSKLVRRATIQALGGLVGTDAAVRQALHGRLADQDDDVQVAAVLALAVLAPSDPDVRSTLSIYLMDTNPSLRAAAVRGLAPLAATDVSIRRGLVVLLTDEFPFVRDAAALVLEGLDPADADVLQALAAGIADFDAFELPGVATRALIRLAAADPATHLAVVGRLSDADDEVRWRLGRVLTALTPTDATVRDALLALLTDALPSLRKVAVYGLARLVPGDQGVCEALETRLTDGEGEVRAAAVQALGALAWSNAASRQMLIIRLSDTDRQVRRAAVWVLGGLAAADATLRQALIACLGDPHEEVRREAVQVLGGVADASPELRQALCLRLTDEASRYIKARVVKVLGALAERDGMVREALVACLADTSTEVQKAALETLAEFAPTDPALREACISHLHRRTQGVPAAAVRALMPLIPEEPTLYMSLLELVGEETIWRDELWEQRRRFSQQLAATYGQVVRTDLRRCGEVIAMLSEEDWERRRAAALILEEAGPEVVGEALPQLLAALEDRRGYSSWPARLAAAERLLNTDRYGEAALVLIQEALAYGAEALVGPYKGARVRQQAALALGKLKALHHRADVAARIVGLLETEQKPEVLDGLYAALGSLAAAPEPL